MLREFRMREVVGYLERSQWCCLPSVGAEVRPRPCCVALLFVSVFVGQALLA